MLDAVREERAIREPGQRVVERLVAELLLRVAASGDVEQVPLENGLGAVGDRRVPRPAPTGSDRRACRSRYSIEERLTRRVRALVSGENALAVVRMQELDEEIADSPTHSATV